MRIERTKQLALPSVRMDGVCNHGERGNNSCSEYEAIDFAKGSAWTRTSSCAHASWPTTCTVGWWLMSRECVTLRVQELAVRLERDIVVEHVVAGSAMSE